MLVAPCEPIAVGNAQPARVLCHWRQVFTLAALFCAPMLSAQTRSDTVLTTAAAVHNLRPDLAPGTHVHLIGAVTYYDPSEQILFLQDATGGVFIETDRTYPIQAGDQISVDGMASASYRTEVAPGAAIRVLGRAAPVPPLPTDYPSLSLGQDDSRLVSVTGTVRDAAVEQHRVGPALHLDLALPDGQIEVYVHQSNRFDTLSLLGARLQVTGVAGGLFDARNQLNGIILYARDSAVLRTLAPPPLDITKLPLTDIDRVFQSLRTSDASERVRVRGAVTWYNKGDGIVLEHDGKGIYAQTRETADIHIGDVVDAFGFASSAQYAPSLREAVLLKTGARERIAPLAVSYEDALSGRYSDSLIALRGKLVSALRTPDAETIVVDVDGRPMRAVLSDSGRLPHLPIGSLVRVAGVCRVAAAGPWRQAVAFRLDMRSPADLRLLARPSWWTIRHLLLLLGLLLSIAVGVAIWALVLRRRVTQQAARIERSMDLACKRSEILQAISSNEPLPSVLARLCGAIESLLPGASCGYTLAGSAAPPANEIDPVLYRTALEGNADEVLGHITVHSPAAGAQRGSEEVFAALRELGAIAIRQSLLHEGLLHHSTHDPLTDLPNRRLFEARLDAALKTAARQGDPLALVYVDVDNFKHINDRYGHRTGDLYLQAIAARLLGELRTTDTLARIGGDEFLTVLPGALPEDADAILRRLKNCFDSPFALEGEHIGGSASFGLACYPEHGVTAEELERHADHAMYLVKHSGNSAAATPVNVLTPRELELALDRDQFRLAYQPQFAADGRLTGLEALLRLEDPILGTLTPDAFIPVAEGGDTILVLGKWVLQSALRDAVRWHLDAAKNFLLAVNVSARQVEQPGFAAMVAECLAASGFPPDRLEIELTERTLLSHSDEVALQLQSIHETGVRIALDDFGTGYSSLSLLHTLPIDTIKLDRSFVTAIDHDSRALPVVQAIVSMARRLDMRIVAEGVEQPGAVTALLRMGPMEFQGYLLSRPVASENIEALLPAWQRGIPMPSPSPAESRKRYPVHGARSATPPKP